MVNRIPPEGYYNPKMDIRPAFGKYRCCEEIKVGNPSREGLGYCSLHEAAPDLLAVVKDMEWLTYPGNDEAECRSCGAWQSEGHKSNCDLAAAIAKAEEAT